MTNIKGFIYAYPNQKNKSIGWGNGYAVIPKGHPFYELSYDEINEYIDQIIDHFNLDHPYSIKLTYSGYDRDFMNYDKISSYNVNDDWVVGFDTHFINANSNIHNKQFVIDQLSLLIDYIQEFSLDTKTLKIEHL